MNNSFKEYLNISGSFCSIIALLLTVSIGLEWETVVSIIVGCIASITFGAVFVKICKRWYNKIKINLAVQSGKVFIFLCPP